MDKFLEVTIYTEYVNIANELCVTCHRLTHELGVVNSAAEKIYIYF